MTCRSVESYLVDIARGVSTDATRRVEIDRHLAGCDGCAARLEEERQLSTALARLAREAEEVPADPRSEQALLAAFDTAWTRPSIGIITARERVWPPLAAAAAVLIAAGVWTIANRFIQVPNRAPLPPIATRAPIETPAANASAAHIPDTPARKRPATTRGHRPSVRPPAATDASAFIPWPGAETLPTFESGRLMRLDLPASIAISLGLLLPNSRSDVVRADILVGQDGLARAVRVAP
jgi:hypothetical protein